jgi:hypothetical protein
LQHVFRIAYRKIIILGNQVILLGDFKNKEETKKADKQKLNQQKRECQNQFRFNFHLFVFLFLMVRCNSHDVKCSSRLLFYVSWLFHNILCINSDKLIFKE